MVKRKILILLAIMGYLSAAYATITPHINTQESTGVRDYFMEGRLSGLEDGFDQGFISGRDYQKGVYAAANNQTVEGKNWYFWAGYYGNTTNDKSSSIDRTAEVLLEHELTTDINPYHQP